MRNVGRWVFAGALALGGLGGSAFAHEKGEEGHAHKELTMDQLPSAVQSTFQKEAAGGQVEELRSEKRGDKTVYEGEVVSNGKGTELQVSEDGSILKRSAPHDEAMEREHGGKR
jgi:multidrug efflux pump subunit AcrA (membrane-fusion protein)